MLSYKWKNWGRTDHCRMVAQRWDHKVVLRGSGFKKVSNISRALFLYTFVEQRECNQWKWGWKQLVSIFLHLLLYCIKCYQNPLRLLLHWYFCVPVTQAKDWQTDSLPPFHSSILSFCIAGYILLRSHRSSSPFVCLGPFPCCQNVACESRRVFRL